MKWWKVFAVVLVLSLTTKSNATSATLIQKIATALTSARSFMMIERAKTPPGQAPRRTVTYIYTVVSPDRFREVTSGFGKDDEETIVIGRDIFTRHVSRNWEVQTWTDSNLRVLKDKALRPGPISASSSGTFLMFDPNDPESDAKLACTYEIRTYRPIECHSAYVSIKFLRYNDSTLAIPRPAATRT